MSSISKRGILGVWLVALILTLALTPEFRTFSSIPREVRVLEGEGYEVDLGLPINLYVRTDKEGVVELEGDFQRKGAWSVVQREPLLLTPVSQGQVKLEFRLFGIIPLRRLEVTVVPNLEVVPGGHSIGVLLKSEGVMVIKLAGIREPSGRLRYPARDAGILVGDSIIGINGQKITSDSQMASLVEEAGYNNKTVILSVKRGHKEFSVEVEPALCSESGAYRIGMWVRDATAGVGTLSFYIPETGEYMALGHIIADADTRKPIDVEDGKIVMASVSGIEPGKRGQPGEKIGVFFGEQDILGNIEKNTSFGILGRLRFKLESPFFEEPVPVALVNQVKPGPAEIITVLEGNRLENFSVEIERVQPQNRPEDKGIVLRITDPRLLESTGGIVQGMSGSPIIQEGRLVGAITHVLVNDPQRGYGVFAEWMILETQMGSLPSLQWETPMASLNHCPDYGGAAGIPAAPQKSSFRDPRFACLQES